MLVSGSVRLEAKRNQYEASKIQNGKVRLLVCGILRLFFPVLVENAATYYLSDSSLCLCISSDDKSESLLVERNFGLRINSTRAYQLESLVLSRNKTKRVKRNLKLAPAQYQ